MRARKTVKRERADRKGGKEGKRKGGRRQGQGSAVIHKAQNWQAWVLFLTLSFSTSISQDWRQVFGATISYL